MRVGGKGGRKPHGFFPVTLPFRKHTQANKMMTGRTTGGWREENLQPQQRAASSSPPSLPRSLAHPCAQLLPPPIPSSSSLPRHSLCPAAHHTLKRLFPTLCFPLSQYREAAAPTCVLGARSSSRRTTTIGRRASARTRPTSDVWAVPWPAWSTRAAAPSRRREGRRCMERSGASG